MSRDELMEEGNRLIGNLIPTKIKNLTSFLQSAIL